MDSKVKKNFTFNLAYQILLILVPVITTPYISRCLGVDNVGIYSFTSSVCSYFTMFITLGFHVFGQREIAKNQGDRKACSQILFDIQAKKLVVSVFVIISYIVFLLIQVEYMEIYLIQIISLVAVFFDISFFYQGLELYSVTVTRNGIIRVIGVLCIFLFVRDKSDLYIYIIINCLVVIFGNITLWTHLKDKYDPSLVTKTVFFKDFRVVIELFIPVFSVQLYFNIDKTMLGILCDGPTENGYYEQALKIIRIFQTVITSLGGVLISGISRMQNKECKTEMRQTIQSSVRLGLFMAVPMVFGLIVISDVFVPCFFGDGYDKVALLLTIMSPILVFSAISNVAGNGVLIPTNQHKYVSVAAVVGAVANIILNAFMIPIWQAMGAAIASVVAELLVLIIQWFYAKEFLKIKELIVFFVKYIVAGSVMCFGVMIIKMMLLQRMPGILLLITLIGCGGLLYFVVLRIEGDGYIKRVG